MARAWARNTARHLVCAPCPVPSADLSDRVAMPLSVLTHCARIIGPMILSPTCAGRNHAGTVATGIAQASRKEKGSAQSTRSAAGKPCDSIIASRFWTGSTRSSDRKLPTDAAWQHFVLRQTQSSPLIAVFQWFKSIRNYHCRRRLRLGLPVAAQRCAGAGRLIRFGAVPRSRHYQSRRICRETLFASGDSSLHRCGGEENHANSATWCPDCVPASPACSHALQ